MAAKWILFYLSICTGVAVVRSQNFPSGLGCDIAELIQWGQEQTADKWLDISIRHSFTDFCGEVDILITNVGGCIEDVTGLIDFFSGGDLGLRDKLDIFYNYLAIIQMYCGRATLTQVCDANAIWGCAIPVVGIAQEGIQGTFQDLVDSCRTYNDVVDSMRLCVETAVSDCTVAEQDLQLGSYNAIAGYFETFASYCGDGCGNYIALLANQATGCQYVLDYTVLDPALYCTYMQNTLNCLWEAYQECPIASPYDTTTGVDSILMYGELLGCHFDISGRTVEDVTNTVALPGCVRAALVCAQNIISRFGITATSGPYGGYNVDGAMDTLRGYLGLLSSKSYYEICYFVNDVVWDTLSGCTGELVLECPETTAGYWADFIIVEQMGKYIRQACHEGCTNLQQVFSTIDECWADVNFDGIEASGTIQDVLLGLFVPGGAEIELCVTIRRYVECVIVPVSECPILYENWVTLIDAYSKIAYVIQFCNIQVNFATGEIEILTDNRNAIFDFMSGAPGAFQHHQMCFMMATLALLALLCSRRHS